MPKVKMAATYCKCVAALKKDRILGRQLFTPSTTFIWQFCQSHYRDLTQKKMLATLTNGWTGIFNFMV